jgi:uncharacterized membrane protein YgdD (TMEM256/DUF423 family)
MNQKSNLVTGALLGLLGVGLGAFGAHALKPMLLASGRLDTYELAVRYQFYHAFALLTVGILQQYLTSKYFKISGLLLTLGVGLFSGSLYLLCFTGITAVAMITPFGGVLMIFGWLFMAIGILGGKK